MLASHQNPLVASLQAELAAASPVLVDNADVLRGILAGCGDCIKILDLEGRLQFMSEGGKRVMEVDDFSKFKGCPWPDFWEGQGNKDAAAAVKSAIGGRAASFRGPANTAKGNPRFWDVHVSPIIGADGKPSHLLSISKDITEEWKAAERQKFLTEELQHRVKNTLANVISIANQTFKAETHRQPLYVFNERLITLDRMHDLLTDANWGNTSIRAIVETALRPHVMPGPSVRIEGPGVDLGPRQALALALAVNELTTNAVKYGSLQGAGGGVDIGWSVVQREGRKDLHWKWREFGGPPVAAPKHVGFGSRVIKDMLANELNGTSSVAYEPSGVVCTVTVPFENLQTAK